MRRTLQAGTLALALALMLGCRDDAVRPNSPAIATEIVGDLRLTVMTDRTVYGRGEPVELTFTAENLGSDLITLQFTSTCHHQFSFRTERRSWLFPHVCGDSLTHRDLAPGEILVGVDSWDQFDDSRALVFEDTVAIFGAVADSSPPDQAIVGPVMISIR